MVKVITEIDNAERDAYWMQLGRFLSYYASVEWQINHLVRRYYRIEYETANIILGPLRYDSAVEHLNRLANAGRIPSGDVREINSIKEQLGPITRLRNDLVQRLIPLHPAAQLVVVKSAGRR